MAVTPFASITQVSPDTVVATWSAIPVGNSGAPISYPDHTDVTFTLQGTFGAGGVCLIQGSNDGVNFYTLTDNTGVAVSKSAVGIVLISEAPRFLRPNVISGDGATSIDVLAKMTRPT